MACRLFGVSMPMSFGILPVVILLNLCPVAVGDIGMNIWVEDGDVMFYVSRSGTFDENNCQLKQGRVRLRLSPNPFKDAKNFRQELKLKDGYVEIAAGNTQIQFWVDVFIRLYM